MISKSVLHRTLYKTWHNGLRLWDFPRLNDPVFYVDAQAAKKAMDNDFAFFRMAERRAFFNVPLIMKELGARNFEGVGKHEIGHDKCPYDLKMCLLMIDAADKVLKNLEKAKYVENIFSDLVVNTSITDKKDYSIVGTYQALSRGKSKDDFWNVYMGSCERLWHLREGSLAQHVDERMHCDAKKIEDIIREVMYDYNKWPSGTNAVARIVKKYLDLQQQGNGNGQKNNQAASGNNRQNQQSKDQQQSPKNKGLIDYHTPKDFLPFDYKKGDKQAEKAVEKELKGLAKKMSPSRYSRVVAGCRIGTRTLALKWFYRDIAAQYTIGMPHTFSHTNELYPETPVEWDVHDEPETLDVVYSISSNGVLIPPDTTYKQKFRKGNTGQYNKSHPDLTLIVDSSPSMPDPRKYLSIPLVSAMVAAHSALNAGVKVGVINFGSEYTDLQHTYNADKIDDELIQYLQGGTAIPGHAVLELVKSNPKPQHILLISDAEIFNLNSEIGYLEEAIKRAGAGGTIFLHNTGNCKKLEDIGFKVHKVTNMKDMLGLTLQTTKQIYGG